ncbi:U4/U6.U5 tri-snRNP component SNU23, partial [Tremellales sp. Uapishka_1]
MADTVKKEEKDEKPGSSRKTWDKDEWAAKARAKDEEHVERAKEAEQAAKTGKRPRTHLTELPKPTKNAEQRTGDLGIEKNLNKTMLVQTNTTGPGQRGGGFYCDLCNITKKDSMSYLDHLNSRIRM